MHLSVKWGGVVQGHTRKLHLRGGGGGEHRLAAPSLEWAMACQQPCRDINPQRQQAAGRMLIEEVLALPPCAVFSFLSFFWALAETCMQGRPLHAAIVHA